MKLDGRKKAIFDLLCENKRLSISELSKRLYVCEMTVRRDLTEMEKQGLLKRYRGGAVFIGVSELPVSRRMYLDADEKRLLAKRAEKHLADNINVFIDASSTCQFIIPHLKKFNNVKVVTNSVQTLLTITKLHVPCFLIGGEFYEQDMCFLGSVSERYADEINVDVAFFSSKGITSDGIISDSSLQQTMMRRLIMKNATKSVFLFEREKVGSKYLYTVCHTDSAYDVIISDRKE